ncbi:hypothetical protein JTB14_027004 [Gonioctena quinquepunctata]|nr:hypothetical protein JTB14_027004 [Gonioctena quinquepunctata]
MKPIDVKTTTKLKIIKNNKGKKMKKLKPKYRVNDIVRISKYKNLFEKGYEANFTTELFKVVKVNSTYPPTYILEDMDKNPIQGSFYEAELQKTQNPDVYLVEKMLKRKGRNVFVKWLGFSNEHNSWVSKNAIV